MADAEGAPDLRERARLTPAGQAAGSERSAADPGLCRNLDFGPLVSALLVDEQPYGFRRGCRRRSSPSSLYSLMCPPLCLKGGAL
jgi:hypothetical protein